MAITVNGGQPTANVTLSAELSAAITDESGTGALIFATSPTLTTPTLGTASATAIELGHATDTTIARVSAGVVSIEGSTILVSGGALGTPSSGTLTNATGLPIAGLTASTSSALGVGSVELGHATDTTLARVSAGVMSIEGVEVTTNSGTQTLTAKTLTSPTINTSVIEGNNGSSTATGTLANTIVKGLNEDINVQALAATGTIDFNVSTASIWYYTTNATANHTLNFRYSASISLNTFMNTGDSLTVVWLNTNGATAYYPSAFQIDTVSVTPKVPAAISAGNASSIDAYSFTIIKTGSATFTVLETQTKFA